MSKLGDFITIKVDPDRNGGLDKATALVTGAYDDGSLRVRVFGQTGDDDFALNYVDDQGDYYYSDDAIARRDGTSATTSTTPTTPAPASTASTPSAAPTPAAATQDAPAPSAADVVAQLTPEERAALLQALQQSSAAASTPAPSPSPQPTPPADASTVPSGGDGAQQQGGTTIPNGA